MKLNNNWWFTLIELLIAITIFMILVVMSFVPYQYYSNIAKVKLASKEISQSISEARNTAINWYDDSWTNQSIGIYFDASNNKVKLFSFNYSSWITANMINNNDYLLKQRELPEWVQIDNVSWNDKVLLYFSSIYWVPKLYDENANLINLDEVDFNISFKWSTNPALNKTVKFYKKTNLTDY